MEKLTPKSDTEQICTNYVESPLISDGRENPTPKSDISIPKQASIEVKLELGASNFHEQRRIQKVPAFLLEEEFNKQDYVPAAVSLGPYHHGKPELKFVEDFKPTALAMFAAETDKDPQFFYEKVAQVIQDVRRCYVGNSTDKYDNDVLARMMLYDACLIINIIAESSYIYVRTRGHLGELVHTLLYRDLLLLENQIPFRLLKLLLHLKFGEEGKEKLRTFLIEWLKDGVHEQTGENNEEEEPLHLLEECRRLVVAHSSKDTETNRSYCHCLPIFPWLGDREKIKRRLGFKRYLHSSRTNRSYWHCLPTFPWLGDREKIKRRLGYKSYIHSFRSVTDLKAKGIRFRRSPTDSLRDIQFKSSPFGAKLQLPTWIVSKITKAFFLNMIAFEMSPNAYTDLAVSSYIVFMKSLIESPKDVKELREKRIIFNMLGSDEEVLRVYKDINTYGMDDIKMFKEVREQIQDHYDSMAKTWVAELVNTYFRSPWSLLALLAAIFLLCLTLVQTYFTIRPPSER